MKKLTALIMATMLLMLAFAGSVSAADSKQPIKVWVENQEVAFDVPPVLVKGTTYVEFKALFKALGYSIAYDAYSKQITGTAKRGSLTLNTVTGEASVNGEKAKKSIQPIIQKGRTLIPLRFIAEATDMNVDWNQTSQTITITSKGPSEADVKELQAFLGQLDAYSNADDMASVLKAVYPGSPVEELLKEQLEANDDQVKTKTTSTLTDILDWQSDSAVIEIVQLSEKVSDGFYLDNNTLLQIQLKRGADKQWKLYMLAPQGMEYINTDEAVSKEADVPADAKASILSVIDKQMQASNDEDLDAYMATLDRSLPQFDQVKAVTKQVFDTYDFKFTLELARIVDYSESEAHVYLVQKTEKTAGPAYDNNRVYSVVKFVKTESGQWVSGDGVVINVESL